jgi:hypothetical protein
MIDAYKLDRMVQRSFQPHGAMDEQNDIHCKGVPCYNPLTEMTSLDSFLSQIRLTFSVTARRLELTLS